jgi:hypothetical protein
MIELAHCVDQSAGMVNPDLCARTKSDKVEPFTQHEPK